MSSPDFYRQQAHRCVILSQAPLIQNVRLWLKDRSGERLRKLTPHCLG
jgi:hypothetical protein